MKIQTKIVLLLAVLIIFFTNIGYGLLRLQINRYHRDIEQRFIDKRLNDAVSNLNQKKLDLYNKCLRWSSDELIVTVTSNSEVPNDIDHMVLDNSDLPLVLIVNTAGKVIYQKGFKFEEILVDEEPVVFVLFKQVKGNFR